MGTKTALRPICWIGLGIIAILGLSSAFVSAKPFPESDVHPLLSTNLQIMARQASGIQPMGDRPDIMDPRAEITVILEPVSGDAARIRDSAIRLAGGEVEARSESLIRVRVPIDRLEDLADDVSNVVFIREPFRPVPLAVVSQGVSLTGASDVHNAGFEGQGAKVAIIDLGFDYLTEAQAAGELQNVVYMHDYTGNGLETEYVHGTGVAEIVEDMAPRADLVLLKIGDSVDLQNATQYCIDNGIHIINHSVGWYNSNYYDGTGVIGGIASNARVNDVLWVNSAGNEASDGHWQGNFIDTDFDSYHEFSVGSDFVDGDSLDEGSRIYATSGDTIVIYMSWDDWTASDQDYDLFLYNSGGLQVASSTNWQTGFQSPTEAIFYDVTSSGYYEIVIQNYNAPQAPEIEIYVYLDSGSNPGLEHHDPTSTIITPANSADVLAVGAIRRTNWTTGPQEAFSSQGPSNDSIHASSRIKPDIAGPDGTLSTTYGSFYGTSASSPHAAGAAALLLSEDPSRTADDLQSLLESSAIDMGAAGKDNIYGSGRLNLEPPLPPPPPPPPPEGLTGWWHFDEGSGTTAADSSGLGNNGTIVGGASWVGGHSGTAIRLDGVNDYVDIPQSSDLEPTTALTIDLWLKFDEISDDWIVDKSSDDYMNGYLLRTDTPSNRIYFYLGSGTTRTNVYASITTATWYHVRAVYDGTQMSLYLNDDLQASAPFAGPITYANTGNLYLGARNGTKLHMSGTLDEVQILGEAQPVEDAAPSGVQDFVAADGDDGQSTLTWTNPGDADLAQVVVQRKTGSYPADHTDGTTVYDNASPVPGAAVSTTDTGLTNGTTVYYAVFSRDIGDNWNDTVTEGANADTGAPTAGASPPSQVLNFAASDGEDGQSTLTWTNPSDADLAQAVVQRKTGSYPADHTDGTTVYDNTSPTPGAAVSTTDTGLTNGTTYYYAVFSRDASDWNDAVTEGSNAETGTPASPALPQPDAVGYWQFDEGSGTTAADSSGLGNNGTIVGGASWVGGHSGTGILLDGVNDYVDIPQSLDLEPATALTIDLWLRFDEISDDWIVDKSSDDYMNGYLLRTDTPSNRIYFYLGSGTTRTSVYAPITTATWYHVRAVYDGTQMSLYLNDDLQASAPFAGPITYTNTGNLYFGARNGTKLHMSGTLDEVQIFGEAQPVEDVAPSVVQDFVAADGDDGQSTLTWTNPSDTDLAQVVVQRKTGSYPADHIDGTTVYDNASPVPGSTVATTNTGLTNGTTYYYAVFSRDSGDNWNDTVTEGSNADTGAPAAALPAPPEGLMGQWAFDEGSGTTAADSSGLGNNGTIVGGASWVGGHSGTGILLDGVNDYVVIPQSSDLEPATALTIDLWLRFDEISDDWIVDKSSDDYMNGYLLRTDTPSNRIYFYLGSGTTRTSVYASITTATWYHVQAVYDGTQMSLYLNDELQASAPFVGPITYTNTGNLYLGARNGTKLYMSGTLDEVAIYSTAVEPVAQSSGSRGPAAISSFDVRMVPNPLRDEAEFRVLGDGIERIRIRVFNLRGQEVFNTQWISQLTVQWHGTSSSGEGLANGMYLLIAEVEFSSGVVSRSDVLKLAILH